MSDRLIDQPTPQPTRKVTASTAAAALVGALVAGIAGYLPGGESAEVRESLTVLVDALVGGAIIGGLTFATGWLVRERAQ